LSVDCTEPGETLRELRLSLNVSQRHLAGEAGVDQAVVSRLERGADARWSTWKRLFSALGREIELTAHPYGADDAEDFLKDGVEARRERMEAGREARW